MFREYLDQFATWLMKKQNAGPPHPEQGNTQNEPKQSLKENMTLLKGILGDSNDVIYREFSFGHGHTCSAGIVYIDGLTNTKLINECIIEPMMYRSQQLPVNQNGAPMTLDDIERSFVTIAETKQSDNIEDVVDGVLSGDTALFVDGIGKVLVMSTRGWEKRGIEEPGNETTIKGPREGFSESLRTNTSLLRRKMKNPDLAFESVIIGRKTRTTVMLCYIKGLASDSVLTELRTRLGKVITDSILSAGMLEQFISGNPYSPFSTINNSEKPDVVAGRLLEGRVAIIIDGTPFVMTVPMFFMESFQTSEDYNISPFFSSFLRLLRYISFSISVLAPAVYVALTTFHQEMIPTPLLYSMTIAREGVPFPAVIEALVLLLAFEIIREAGIRLPRPVGQAISIVGALVMGQSAVAAGLVSAPLVIMVAITAVANFVVPMQADAATLMRYILLILGAWMGGVGIVTGLLMILIHLSAIRSFGVPFLSPYAPLQPSDLKDSFVRLPLWMMIRRPAVLAKNDQKRADITLPGKDDKQNNSNNSNN